MSEKNDGGPAFPCLERFEKFNDNAGTYVESFAPVGGMSLRDHFAGQALIGILAMNAGVTADAVARTEPSRLAANAYLLADAMITERAK